MEVFLATSKKMFRDKWKRFWAFFTKLFDLLFDYIAPEYFGIAGGLMSLLTFIVSTILYSLGDPFSIFTVYVSNISIGPHGSGIVFGIGMSFSVLLMIPFVVGLFRWLWSTKFYGNLFLSLGVLTGICAYGSFVVLLFFDMETAAMVHDLGSAGFFSFSFLMSLFLTISMELNDKASKRQWAFTSTLLTTAIIFFPWYIYTISSLMFPFRKMAFDDWVLMMTSLDPKMDGVRYFEWMGVIFAIAWLIQTGFHYHKSRLHQLNNTGLVEEKESIEVREDENSADSAIALPPEINLVKSTKKD